MILQRLPRRLLYRWTPLGVEIEYPGNILDPPPNIVCDSVQVIIPPVVPGTFTLWGRPVGGAFRIVAQSFSFAQPEITTFFWANNPTRFEIGMRVLTFAPSGQLRWTNAFGSLIAVDWYLTPGNTQQPRRDLLVGGDRLINPNLNTPCPTWRITGGNCPEGSIDCGDCCLDCNVVNARIRALI